MEYPPARVLMYFVWFIAMCATLFNAIIIIGASKDQDVVQDLYWGKGSQSGFGSSVDIYIGVFNFVTKSSSGGFGSTDTTSLAWDSDNCTPDYCEDCYRNMGATIALALLALVLTFPAVFSDYARASAAGNTAFNKTIGTVSSIATVVTGIVAVVLFSAGCQNKLENETTQVDWSFGPSAGLMIAVIVFKFVDALCNMLIPVEGEGFCGAAPTPATTSASGKPSTSDREKVPAEEKSEKMINQV